VGHTAVRDVIMRTIPNPVEIEPPSSSHFSGRAFAVHCIVAVIIINLRHCHERVPAVSSNSMHGTYGPDNSLSASFHTNEDWSV
jgi:hypothetical protein